MYNFMESFNHGTHNLCCWWERKGPDEMMNLAFYTQQKIDIAATFGYFKDLLSLVQDKDPSIGPSPVCIPPLTLGTMEMLQSPVSLSGWFPKSKCRSENGNFSRIQLPNLGGSLEIVTIVGDNWSSEDSWSASSYNSWSAGGENSMNTRTHSLLASWKERR
jgi:hypothetical protein